jgi:23S rRNA pseudouridine1911/1915/1917 synthase
MSSVWEQIRVLYEDNHLLAVFKPPGILVQGDRTGDPSLLEWGKDWLRARYRKPGRVFLGLVHRLDRPVSGVVLLARTTKAAARLSEQFRERRIEKVYWAVVHGRPDPPAGELADHLAKRGLTTVRVSPEDSRAKAATLRYRTLETSIGLSLVEIRLITGRHHQIRSQFAALGHPVVGDHRYGAPRPSPSRLLGLLARSLTCRHPTRPVDITFLSPLPSGWPWQAPKF